MLNKSLSSDIAYSMRTTDRIFLHFNITNDIDRKLIDQDVLRVQL